MAASKTPSNRPRKARAQKSNNSRSSRGSRASGDGLAGLVEQLVSRIITPLGLVLLSRERIQETLDEAAERGRLTRSDANDLVALLVQRGRQQIDELLADGEGMLVRGRQRLDEASRRRGLSEPFDLLMRGADKARRKMGGADSFPIIGYEDLTSAQVQSRLGPLSAPELRRVREYERAHANRKSVLAAVEKRLG